MGHIDRSVEIVGGTISANPSGGTPLDGSPLSITAGGSSQQIFAARPDRIYLFVQNLSPEVLWVNLGAAATADAPSIQLFPNGAGILEYNSEFVPDSTVTIIGATTGSKFSAKEM